MLIRSATVADIPALMALERDAPSAAHWSRRQYEVAVGGVDRVAFIIEGNFIVRAFLVARVLGVEWEIENIVVARAHRNRGLGTRLLDEAFGQAGTQKAKAVFLEVRESNRAAIFLYEKTGFAQTGRRLRYYHEPEEDALIYRRAIP